MTLRAAVLPICMALTVGATACDPSTDERADTDRSRSLAEIREAGTLVVATRNAPTTWYIDRDEEPAGPEYDLVESFADWLGVDTEYQIHETIGEVMAAVEAREVDLGAAGLTITEERRERFLFGPPYQPVKQQLVCRRGGPQPQTPAELPGTDLHVIANSSYVERLEELREDYPELTWSERDTATEILLQEVWDREIECTIADSTIARMNRRLFPELVLSQDLTDEQDLGWVLPPGRNDVADAIGDWLTDFEESGELTAHRDRYYGHYETFDYVNVRRFMRRIDERFRQYEHWFRQAADEHDLPFELLAALSYQESHWNPQAVSPTGVRGIMMLTQRAAEQVEVDNRIDPEEAIFGGARYLAWMRSRISEEAGDPDRVFLALAAYNVGRGHLHDAQGLARELGRDPHSWADMREVLPLLADPDYYQDLRFGYARGMEPVIYVTRIREYWQLMEDYLYGHPAFPG